MLNNFLKYIDWKGYQIMSSLLYKAPTYIHAATDTGVLGLGSSTAFQNSKDLPLTNRVPVIRIPPSAAELIHITHSLHLVHLGCSYELSQVSPLSNQTHFHRTPGWLSRLSI